MSGRAGNRLVQIQRGQEALLLYSQADGPGRALAGQRDFGPELPMPPGRIGRQDVLT